MPSQDTSLLHSLPLFLKNVCQNEEKHDKPAPSLYAALFRFIINKETGKLVNTTETGLFLYMVPITAGKLTVPSHQPVTTVT